MNEKYIVDQKLVDAVREFLANRYALHVVATDNEDGYFDSVLSATNIQKDKALEAVKVSMYSALDFVLPRINEFGPHAEYVKSLIDDENTDFDALLVFLDKFLITHNN